MGDENKKSTECGGRRQSLECGTITPEPHDCGLMVGARGRRRHSITPMGGQSKVEVVAIFSIHVF